MRNPFRSCGHGPGSVTFATKIQSFSASRNVGWSPVPLSLEGALDPTENGQAQDGAGQQVKTKQSSSEEGRSCEYTGPKESAAEGRGAKLEVTETGVLLKRKRRSEME